MQVDDKLAKEKLDRICFQFRREKGAIDGYEALIELSELIRNTDLTDCQQPMEDLATKIANTLGQLNATPYYWQQRSIMESFVRDIAPAPDQGSVRNATDEQDK